ncbi:MAG: EAL domain-containing protein [Rhodocyclales bacterium]|nr:EAL domain-containing protein [Rhodocyclales bacterium]
MTAEADAPDDDKLPGGGQFFRYVVENAVDGFFIIDEQRRFIEANAAMCRMFGRVRDEIIGKTPLDLVAPESHAELFAQIQSIETTEHRRYQVLAQRKDGSKFPVLLNNTSYRDSSGVVAGSFGFITDLTSLVEAQQAVAASERELQGILDNMQDTYYRTDAGGRVVRASRSVFNLLGYKPEEVLGKPLADLYFDPADRQDFLQRMAERGGTLSGYDSRLRHKAGHEVWVLTNAQYLRDAAGKVIGIEGTTRDNTEQRRVKENLRLAAQVFENSGESIMIMDARSHVVSVNRAFVNMTGYLPAEVHGRTPAMLTSDLHDEEFYQRMWHSLRETGYWQGELWNRRRNGEVYPEWLGISTLRGSDGAVTHYVAISTDISERKASEARIEFLAHHDPLTDLPNRLLLRDRLERAIAQGERTDTRVALLFIDLDRFKTVNDSLGHPVGDRLLREAAQRLRQCVREMDTVSRQGGDEFLIVLCDLKDGDAVTRVAEHILAAMSVPFSLDGHDVAISCSVGVAVFPEDGRDFDELLKKSDIAMYHAKEAGRNAFRYYTERMNIDALERLDLQNRLRRGLEQGEFVLHYQPVVELASNRVVGAEALVRWNSPDSGLVMPGRFIAVAEECGLIVPLGDWVLREACRQLRRWQDAGHDRLTLAVNLSAIQFRRGSVEESVVRALRDAGANPAALELELTESILLQGAEHVLATVRQLKSLGVKLSIDDFGTGYSSLAYLKRFAVDKLKIDQSFVSNLPADADNAAIVAAVIQMAKSLNLQVLAEGVENVQAVEHLRSLRCDYVQGYHFGRPVPADEFATLIR